MRRADDERIGSQETPAGLRRIVVVAAVILGLVTIGVSSSLMVLTTYLHDTAISLRQTVRGSRTARETQVNLLRLERSGATVSRPELERKVREAVANDFRYPTSSPTTLAQREEAKLATERFLATREVAATSSAEPAAALEAAVDALERVARAGASDADAALERAARLDMVGNAVGVVSVAVMIAGLAFVVQWTRRSLIRPMVALSNAMNRFSRGDLGSRARPAGPDELRRMMQQFNTMGDKLEEQHQQRLTHLAGIAHDLRNPLSALQMSASLIDADAELPPPATIRRAFALVRRQVIRLDRMVSDIVDAARIDAGHLTLDLRPTDLRDVIVDVEALFKNVSALHQVEVELPETPLPFRGDAARIEQVLSNLVSNAIKYSPSGGRVRIRAFRDRNTVNVSVSDEGIGIRQSDIGQLWEPFRRASASASTIPGVGLGLWTTKRIAEAHRGHLRVESTFGEGSTFTLVLPRDEATPHAELHGLHPFHAGA